MAALANQTQFHISLPHITGLTNFALIKTHEIGSFAGKPTSENFIAVKFTRQSVGERKEFFLHLSLAAKHIDIRKHAGRCGVTDVNDLIRFSLTAELRTVHLEARGIANLA